MIWSQLWWCAHPRHGTSCSSHGLLSGGFCPPKGWLGWVLLQDFAFLFNISCAGERSCLRAVPNRDLWISQEGIRAIHETGSWLVCFDTSQQGSGDTVSCSWFGQVTLWCKVHVWSREERPKSWPSWVIQHHCNLQNAFPKEGPVGYQNNYFFLILFLWGEWEFIALGRNS